MTLPVSGQLFRECFDEDPALLQRRDDGHAERQAIGAGIFEISRAIRGGPGKDDGVRLERCVSPSRFLRESLDLFLARAEVLRRGYGLVHEGEQLHPGISRKPAAALFCDAPEDCIGEAAQPDRRMWAGKRLWREQ